MRPTPALLAGLILGATIWLLSPTITGHAEPWDARDWYYPTALIASGLLIGLATRRWTLLAILGLYFGQAIIMAIPDGPGGNRAPWYMGALVLAYFTTISLGTSLLVVTVRWLLSWRSSHAAPSSSSPKTPS